MSPILYSLIIVGGIGLVCAVLLVLASHFFRVEEEEMTGKIRECLPGANCGACGYPGCDGYAKAVALGQSAPNLCIPGSVSVAKKLSELLGVEVKTEKPQVAFVKCNGTCSTSSRKAVYDGVTTCKAISQIYGGHNTCVYGCLGCGDCFSACPSDAICIKGGVAHINPKDCIGCGMCVAACPKNIISLHPRDAKVAVMCSSEDKGAAAKKACENACIGCKKCEKTCPEGAITVENNIAKIDYEKCTGCGKCHGVCPTNCIKSTDFAAAVISW